MDQVSIAGFSEGFEIENIPSLYLDWKERPIPLQKRIQEVFNYLKVNTKIDWGIFNGSKRYSLLGIEEQDLLKTIINSSTDRKDFYVLDIGAGDFRWGKCLSDYIDDKIRSGEIENDITVHIFNIRGETNLTESHFETENCKIHNLGGFKVEDLLLEFRKLEIDIENKVDLAISRWCFKHLADPLGTFCQAYNLLRPETGLFLLDGFYFLYKKDLEFESIDLELKEIDPVVQMIQLFFDAKIPFLSRGYTTYGALGHFILRRLDDNPCRLPMSYFKMEDCLTHRWKVESGTITKFIREPQEGEPQEGEPQEGDEEVFDKISNYDDYRYCDFYTVYGDRNLYDYLIQNNLFYTDSMIDLIPKWSSLIEEGE